MTGLWLGLGCEVLGPRSAEGILQLFIQISQRFFEQLAVPRILACFEFVKHWLTGESKVL